MTNVLSPASPSPLMFKARRSGKCPLTLIRDNGSIHGRDFTDGFDEAVMRVIDTGAATTTTDGDLSIRSDIAAGKEFDALLKMAQSVDMIPGQISLQEKATILESRRCILLAILGSTPPNNTALKHVLNNGYLIVVKSWLDDILKKTVGGVDLLLHLLTNIISLPVTKEMVSTSKLGKAVVAVEKHRICVGGKNENAIKERIVKLKEEWSASVKLQKKYGDKANPEENGNGSVKRTSDGKIPTSSLKRSLDSSSSNSSSSAATSTKRAKSDRGVLSTSNLIRKASSTGSETTRTTNTITKQVDNDEGKSLSAAEQARLRAQERLQKEKERLASMNPESSTKESISDGSADKNSETRNGFSSKRRTSDNSSDAMPEPKKVKWADKVGENLIQYHDREITEEEQIRLSEASEEEKKKGRVSWTDRKKRDRLREKEMMEKARGDTSTGADDYQARLDAMGSTNPPLVPWHKPHALSSADISSVQVISNELAKQVSRMATVTPARYLTDNDVPKNPVPLNDIELALDMASQASSITETIPFFTPQQERDVVTQAISSVQATQQQAQQQPLQQQQSSVYPATNVGLLATSHTVPPPPPPHSVLGASFQQGATVEVVQALGLPAFLAGNNLQALQTLAASPSLLNTFIDSNGMYDQARLLSLVQTLAQSVTPAQPIGQTPQTQFMNQTYSASSNQQYSMSGLPVAGAPGFHAHGSPPPPPPPFQTQQSSYVAPPQSNYANQRTQNNRQNNNNAKGGSGYRGDQNGSEGNLHLSGYGPSTTTAEIMAMFSPYVNVVEVVNKSGFSFVNTRDPAGARRAREALTGALLGGRPVRINIATRKALDPSHNEGKAAKQNKADVRTEPAPLPRNSLGQIEYDKVRDDRGNPATKNLFVAGYGPGTTEQQLRDIFGAHAKVTGAVMKGSFAFVNTTDRISAVTAREALTGSVINGGVLRINFAKESGRLGTSFDTTYGPSTRPNGHMRNGVR